MVVDLLEVNLLHPAVGGLGRPISLLSLDGLALVDRAMMQRGKALLHALEAE